MLRFERNPYSKTLGLKLREKNSLWSHEFILALLFALALHFSFPFLFKIKSLTSPQVFTLPKIKVVTESHAGPLLLDIKQTAEFGFDPPPGIQISPLIIKTISPFSLIQLDRNQVHAKLSAYIRGEYPQKLDLEKILVINNEKEFFAEINIRTDQQGKLFWYDWLKKPQNLEITKNIEALIKTLTFDKKSAFLPQTLEIHFVS